MLVCAVVCSVLLLAAEAPADVRQQYQAARTQAGRDADAQVRLALWCEAHGLTTERLRHLALAIGADPQHAAARGLLGFVRDGGGWRRAEQVAERARTDAAEAAALAEYNARRAKAKNDADDQWELAVWCEQRGLAAEASAHFTAVTLLDPGRDAAWKRLGYKKRDGRWKTDAQVEAEKLDAEAQRRADKQWRPLLEQWKRRLNDPKRRAEAEAELAKVDDPRAVPMVVAVFGRADPARAVQLLGQIDTMTSSRALAALAVFGRTEEVRRRSTETLRWRDPREYADLLIGLLRKPIKYEVRRPARPGSAGELFVEGQRADLRRTYAAPTMPAVATMPGDRLDYDADGLPVIRRYMGYTPPAWVNGQMFLSSAAGFIPTNDQVMGALVGGGFGSSVASLDVGQRAALSAMVQGVAASHPAALMRRQATISASRLPVGSSTYFSMQSPVEAAIPVGRMEVETRRAAAMSQQQLEADVAALDAYNAPIRDRNDRVAGVLNAATGQALAAEPAPWRAWFIDQIGFRNNAQQVSRPLIEQEVGFQPTVPVNLVSGTPVITGRISCFGAGTPVHTLGGLRPIEDVQVGDRVLSQDAATGELSYQPVLVVHHNPPGKTLKVTLEGGESVVSSTFHRFWRAGRGWAMARELEPGQELRTLGGLAALASVADDRVQPVYNLDVAGGRTFFVGGSGVLVHDNSLPDTRIEPFDAPAVAAR